MGKIPRAIFCLVRNVIWRREHFLNIILFRIIVAKEEGIMKRDALVTKLRKLTEKADVSNVDFLAVQVNLTDQDPGVFYVEVKDHKISVEPYEYNDRNCAISIKSDDFNKLMTGKLDPSVAFGVGKLKIDGDLGKALEFSKLLK